MKAMGCWCAGLGLALMTAMPALAGPEEDYARGRQAFHGDDLIGAMKWLRQASQAEHAAAQALLAYILDRAEEDAEALRLYSKAANSGNPDAMFGLAGMYASGEGVEADPAQAVHWYQRAAAQGHEHAGVVLAEAHLQGRLGLRRNPAQGLELLKRGAARGYVPARELLARLEARGQ